MKTGSLVVPILLSSLLGAARADDAREQLGRQVYQRWCIDCHGSGPGLMGLGLTGTAALAAKYDGTRPALLEERTDLTPAFVSHFVRHGISVMPFFRRTEISRDELDALGAYLSRPRPGAASP